MPARNRKPAPCPRLERVIRNTHDVRNLITSGGSEQYSGSKVPGITIDDALVAALFLKGLTRPQIAVETGLAEHTVRHRLERVRKLTGKPTSEEAARAVLGLEMHEEAPAETEAEALRREVAHLMERPTRDAYLRLEDAVHNSEERIKTLTEQRDAEASKAGLARQRVMDLEQERDAAIERGKDFERMHREGIERQNGLYMAIVARVEPFFDPESRDLEWDVLPGSLAGRFAALQSERDSRQARAESVERQMVKMGTRNGVLVAELARQKRLGWLVMGVALVAGLGTLLFSFFKVGGPGR
jgi:hypothetical protein